MHAMLAARAREHVSELAEHEHVPAHGLDWHKGSWLRCRQPAGRHLEVQTGGGCSGAADAFLWDDIRVCVRGL